MADTKKIAFHQTLHGYEEGHTLLASSCELNNQERRLLSLMSDYSGSGFDTSFSSYLTGYPLPNSKYYAFARTWYASEMARPGCVWTHTLLIDIAHLGQLKSLDWLNSLFQRPDINKYSSYSVSFEVDQENDKEEKISYTDEYYALSYALYDKYDKAILVPSQSAKEYESLILQLWTQQWPRLRRSFSFCTGSLALRTIDNKPLDLQIIPVNRLVNFNRKDNGNAFILNLKESLSFPDPQFKQLKIFHYDEIIQFMKKYGYDVAGARSRYLPLLYYYEILEKEKNKSETPETILNNLIIYFPNFDEARSLKKTLVDSLITTNTKEVIEFLIKNDSSRFEVNDINIIDMISSSWMNNNLSITDLKSIVREYIKSNRTSSLLELLSNLPFEAWFEFDFITSDILGEKMISNILIKDIQKIFESDIDTQNHWLEIFLGNKKTDWNIVLEAVLINNKVDWLLKIILSRKEKALNILFEKTLKVDKFPPEKSIDLIKENYIFLFKWLAEQKLQNKSTLTFIIQVFSPTADILINVESKVWSGIIKSTLRSEISIEQTGLLTFLITACFVRRVKGVENILPLIFQPLHDSLKADISERITWNRFSYLMGNELYYLWEKEPFSFWLFKPKFEIVPEWDKCEFLRRSLISSFISNEWDIGLLIKSVHDKETFDHLMAFATSIKAGTKLAKRVKEFLKNNDVSQKDDLYDIVKHHLK